ncbi:10968_t:CDS:2, partial [Gigaspora margarita]
FDFMRKDEIQYYNRIDYFIDGKLGEFMTWLYLLIQIDLAGKSYLY